MDIVAVAGLVIIIGSLVFMFAGWGIGGVHDRDDAGERIEYIRQRWPAYRRSQILFAASALTVAVGLALLSAGVAASADQLLHTIAAVAVIGGAVAWIVFAYQRTVHFETYFADHGPFPWAPWAWLLLSGTGLTIYAFLFHAQAAWLSYVIAAALVTLVLGALTAPRRVPPQLLAVATLMIGIVAALAPEVLAG